MRMKELRQQRGWSQTHTGMLAGGISQADISAIEHGRRIPGAGWRQRLARVFGVSEAELFGERRESPEPGR